jgi:hypothetical protein
MRIHKQEHNGHDTFNELDVFTNAWEKSMPTTASKDLDS